MAQRTFAVVVPPKLNNLYCFHEVVHPLFVAFHSAIELLLSLCQLQRT